MLRPVLYCKLHHAAVTQADPEYVGSITIDADLLKASGLRVNDKVLIANCRNGERFETYVFRGEPGSGIIGINGAAALLAQPGDRVIILHFAQMSDAEYAEHHPRVLVMNADNTIAESWNYDPDPVLASVG
ncbi:MAG: aspartate 1-decarboxylase [Phycisphaerales bacterium]|nr:aspartate 1-decarboxylase [Phycisphaerales bacterium]